MIELKDIGKRFRVGKREITALDDVTLSIEEGEIFGLIGTSGAGKSTLLRCINLLERPDSGDVLVEGLSMLTLGRHGLIQRRRDIGMIFQQFNLLDSKTIFDNVAMPMRLAGIGRATIKSRVEELLGFVELADKANTYPPRLSGGQKQRVGIARALATNPKILLADEATSALDPETTDSILELLKRVNRELGLTIVVVTHEMQVIAKTCERVAVMSHGRVVEQGRVLDVFAEPQEAITRRFVRTIVDDRIPDSMLDMVRQTEGDYALWRLTAKGHLTNSSVISEVHKRLPVTTRLLYASMHEIDGRVLSVLILQVLGDEASLADARDTLSAAGYRVTDQDVTQLEQAVEEGSVQ